MKSKKGPNIFLCAAVVLLCLVLVSAHFTAGIFAKMSSTSRDGDEGRLAAFGVTAELTPGAEAGAYQLTLTNASEVAVRCDLTVTLDRRASGTVRLGDLAPVTFTDAESVRIENVGTLAPGASLAPMALVVELTDAAETEEHFTDRSNDSVSGSGENCPFVVVVGFTQVD